MGYCNSLHPSVRSSVMLSLPKPLDEIQPNLVCELLTCIEYATAVILAAPPLGRGENLNDQISITKSISKIFNTNFVCISQNKDNKTH